jgi:phosphoribosylformimino-5-aminoimidazole carboxamide ribotide isomerase
VIPAIDVLGDEAVRLVRGSYDDIALRRPDPLELVRQVVAAGATLVHVVDLTAARSGRVRSQLFHDAVAAADPAGVQASGGIRSVADALEILRTGAARLVVGTAAFVPGDTLEQLVAASGERLVVAIDVRDGLVATRGWEETTAVTVARAVTRCVEAGVPRLLCTAIERDGTMSGPSLPLLDEVVRTSGLPVIAAGGIRSLADVAAVESVGCEAVVVGRALLEGHVPLSSLGAERAGAGVG